MPKARMLLSGWSRQVVPVMLKVRQKRPALNRRIPPSRHKVLTMVVRKAAKELGQRLAAVRLGLDSG